MTDLKTLRDIESFPSLEQPIWRGIPVYHKKVINEGDTGVPLKAVLVRDLHVEAVKRVKRFLVLKDSIQPWHESHVKDAQEKIMQYYQGKIDELMNFFNLTEEDLKDAR